MTLCMTERANFPPSGNRRCTFYYHRLSLDPCDTIHLYSAFSSIRRPTRRSADQFTSQLMRLAQSGDNDQPESDSRRLLGKQNNPKCLSASRIPIITADIGGICVQFPLSLRHVCIFIPVLSRFAGVERGKCPAFTSATLFFAIKSLPSSTPVFRS